MLVKSKHTNALVLNKLNNKQSIEKQKFFKKKRENQNFTNLIYFLAEHLLHH